MWPRENFNNVFNALITVFIVIVAEDWNQVMYLYVRAAGESSPLSWNIALIYFLLTMIIGNIILLALFTALLLKNFDPSSDDNKEGDDDMMEESKFNQIQSMKSGAFNEAG